MTDAQDTITIDGFGKMRRHAGHKDPWYQDYADRPMTSLELSVVPDGRGYASAFIHGVSHTCFGVDMQAAYVTLMGSMSREHRAIILGLADATPDDVAAIRALGER